jgi:uncharacterized protein (DUF1330 family)
MRIVTVFVALATALMQVPAALAEEEEAPAYLIVLGEVHDREAFMEGYASRLGPLYERYGGTYLGIGQDVEVLEGDLAPQSFVVARWPSMEAARSFWFSEEYQALRKTRIEEDWARFDVVLVPGLPARPSISDPE